MSENNQQPIVLKANNLSQKIKDKGARIIIGTLNVFTNPVGQRPEKYYLDYRKKKVFDLTVLLVVLGLIAVSFFFWFIFKPKPVPVSLAISVSPEQVISGQAMTYLLKYENESDEPIEGLTLAFKFPDNFFFQESQLADFDSNNNTLFLGDLKSGANGEVKIKGIIWGQSAESQKLEVILSCPPTENKKYARYLTAYSFNIAESLYQFDLVMPKKIFNNSPFDFSINYKNQTEFDLDKIFFNFSFPDGFRLIETDGRLVKRGDRWELENLTSQTSGELKFKGLMSKTWQATEEPIDFYLSSGLVFQNKEIKYGQTAFSSQWVFPKLFLSQEIVSPQGGVSLAEEVEYLIKYQNQEAVNATEVKIIMDLPERFFDLTTAVADNLTVENNQLIWLLDKLSAGQSGQANLKIKVKKSISASAEENNLSLTSNLSAQYKLADDLEQSIVVVAPEAVLKLNSDLILIAEARYFTPHGDQLGIGPLPPRVGLSTKYWIFFRVLNTTNMVNDVQLEGYLSPAVKWTGRTSVSSGPAFEYNAATQKIGWLIGEINQHSGKIYPEIDGAFEIEIEPQSSDAGQVLNLLYNVKLTGLDEFTGQRLESRAGSLTTDLKTDEIARKFEGRVRE